MNFLRMRLLGAPRVELNGQSVHFGRRHALALGVYLALSGHSCSRETLAALFWPDASSRAGHANLRRILHVLGRAIGHDFLIAEEGQIRFAGNGNLWIDTIQFYRLTASYRRHCDGAHDVCPGCLAALAQAADLYRDDFLAGFSLRASPDFDQWQLLESEQLRIEMAYVLQRLVHECIRRGQYLQAILYAQRQLTLDPLYESSHRILMQLYAWTGQPAAVQRQYELCTQMLNSELSLDPAPETTDLYRAAISGRVLSPQAPAIQQIPFSTPIQGEIRTVTVLSISLAHLDLVSDDLDLNAHVQTVTTLALLVEGAAQAFGGHVETVVGEDILALFYPAPMQEDGAVRAVHTAFAVRQQADDRNIPVRIAINTGTVYCGRPSGPAGRTIMIGPLINRASRLRDLASDQILADHKTYLASRMQYDCIPQTFDLPGGCRLAAYAILNSHRQQPGRLSG